MGFQFTVLGVWCAFACGESVSQERLLKTYDFQRTTGLSSAELMLGKLLGSPVLGYFVIGCSMIFSIPAAILGDIGIGVIAATYVLLLTFALFISTIGLWISMLNERTQTGTAVVLILGLMSFAAVTSDSRFPGLTGLSSIPALVSLYSNAPQTKPTIFGMETPSFLMTLLMQAAFGAWFVLMLTRNLKKDRSEIRLLSRKQAIGLAAFFNLLFYALLKSDPPIEGSAFEGMTLMLTAIILFSVGLASLTPREKLKLWWRKYKAGEESYFSESGLVWPWMILAGIISYAVHLAARGLIPVAAPEENAIHRATLQMIIFVIFITRDVLFLQFCSLTRMKRPLLAGALYLMLYYAAVMIVATRLPNDSAAQHWFLNILTMSGVSFSIPGYASVYAGILFQAMVFILLLNFTHARLTRLAAVPEPA